MNCNVWWTGSGSNRRPSPASRDAPCAQTTVRVYQGFGGPGRDRTDDLFHAMEARSQLRHRPTRRGNSIVPDMDKIVKRKRLPSVKKTDALGNAPSRQGLGTK